MIYEHATFFGRRAIKPPLMEAVRREVKLMDHERKQRVDELRSLMSQFPNDVRVPSWREEMILLYESKS